MEHNLPKAIRALLYAAVGLLSLVVVAIVGIVIFESAPEVQNLKITNVSDNSATITWTSSSPRLDSVVYTPEGSPANQLGLFGGERFFDDRDIIQTGSIINYFQLKSRYTHHVTLTNLQPEKEYSFNIVGAIKSTAAAKFTTGAVLDSLRTPEPTYGVVPSSANDDVLVFMYLSGGSVQSTITNATNGYSLDKANVRSEDGLGLTNYTEGTVYFMEYVTKDGASKVFTEVGKDQPVVTPGSGGPEVDPASPTPTAVSSVLGANIMSNVSAGRTKCGPDGDIQQKDPGGILCNGTTLYTCDANQDGAGNAGWKVTGTCGAPTAVQPVSPSTDTGTTAPVARPADCSAAAIGRSADKAKTCCGTRGTVCGGVNRMNCNSGGWWWQDTSCKAAGPAPAANTSEQPVASTVVEQAKDPRSYADCAVTSLTAAQKSGCNEKLISKVSDCKNAALPAAQKKDCATLTTTPTAPESSLTKPVLTSVECSVKNISAEKTAQCKAAVLDDRIIYCTEVEGLGAEEQKKCSDALIGTLNQNTNEITAAATLNKSGEKVNEAVVASDRLLNTGTSNVGNVAATLNKIYNVGVSSVETVIYCNDPNLARAECNAERLVTDKTVSRTCPFNKPYMIITTSQSYSCSASPPNGVITNNNTSVDCEGMGIVNVNEDGPGYCVNGAAAQLNNTLVKPAAAQSVLGANVLGATTIPVSDSGVYNLALTSATFTTGVKELAVIKGAGDTAQIQFFNDLNADSIKQDNEPYVDEQLEVKLDKQSDIYSYDLKEGWNLIGFNMVGEDVKTSRDLVSLIAKQGGYATSVYTYRGGKWVAYTVRGNEEFGLPINLVPGEGYFIKVITPATIAVNGLKALPNNSLSISNGWNLISFRPEGTLTAAGLLEKINKNISFAVDTCTKYSNGRYENVVIQDGTTYGLDFTLSETSGYFVRASKGGAVWKP